MTSVPDPGGRKAEGVAHETRTAGQHRLSLMLARLGARWLRRTRPDLSSATRGARWQFAIPGLVALLLGACVFAPEDVRIIADAVAALSVAAYIVLRSSAIMTAMGGSGEARGWQPAEWPTYSVLVPLRGEAEVLPGLVAAIEKLEYPRHRLEVLLVLEADDRPTCEAARRLRLPDVFQIVELPPCTPATKPKALAAALWIARGELVTVYDAEDSPAPDQLKRAAERLTADPRLGCVQARLVIHNAEEGWLARQFALEYAAQFGGLLPLLAKLDAPVLLGGTSNHFRRSILMKIGGWDPYNVTEDADIGIRLARCGYRVGTIASETREEAPRHLTPWLRQRTRWMKGWMQTWCVHMRHPGRLAGELGLRRFVYLQLTLTGSLGCALIHPLFYILLAIDVWNGSLLSNSKAGLDSLLAWVGAVNFAMAYLIAAVSMLCFGPAASARPTVLSVIGIPIYWLLISAATWRAVWKLVAEPFVWEKTPHAARPPTHPQHAREP